MLLQWAGGGGVFVYLELSTVHRITCNILCYKHPAYSSLTWVWKRVVLHHLNIIRAVSWGRVLEASAGLIRFEKCLRDVTHIHGLRYLHYIELLEQDYSHT